MLPVEGPANRPRIRRAALRRIATAFDPEMAVTPMPATVLSLAAMTTSGSMTARTIADAAHSSASAFSRLGAGSWVPDAAGRDDLVAA